jgi:hypothetical protein
MPFFRSPVKSRERRPEKLVKLAGPGLTPLTEVEVVHQTWPDKAHAHCPKRLWFGSPVHPDRAGGLTVVIAGYLYWDEKQAPAQDPPHPRLEPSGPFFVGNCAFCRKATMKPCGSQAVPIYHCHFPAC